MRSTYIPMCMSVLVAQLYLTLCDPMDCSPPGSSVHEILQARILGCVAMSFSRVYPYRPAKLSKQHPSLPLPLQIQLGLLDHMDQAATQLAWQPKSVENSSLVLGLTQNQQLWGLLSEQTRVTHPIEEYAASNSRDPLGVVPLFWLQEGPDTTIYPDFLSYFPHTLSGKSLDSSW